MQPGLQCSISASHLGAPLRLLRGAASRGRSAGRQDVVPLLGILNGVRVRDEVGRQRRTRALLGLMGACSAWSSAFHSKATDRAQHRLIQLGAYIRWERLTCQQVDGQLHSPGREERIAVGERRLCCRCCAAAAAASCCCPCRHLAVWA